MDNYVMHLDDYIKFDRKKLLQECYACEFEDFVSSKTRGDVFDRIPEWQRADATGEEVKRIGKQLEKILGCNLDPKFFIQQANFQLPYHRDSSPTIAINILLKGNSPITFSDCGDVHYDIALINIKEKHTVKASPNERIILRYPSFDDIDFHQARQKFLQCKNF